MAKLGLPGRLSRAQLLGAEAQMTILNPLPVRINLTYAVMHASKSQPRASAANLMNGSLIEDIDRFCLLAS